MGAHAALCQIKTSKEVDDSLLSGLDECPGRPRKPAFRNGRESRAGIEHGHVFAWGRGRRV